MSTLLNTPDGVIPTGCGWLSDWNCGMARHIAQAEEVGDERRVDALLRSQVSINGFFKRPYWPAMAAGRAARS